MHQTMRSFIVGHIDCLNFLIENGCPLEDIAVSGAVKGGHLKAVEILVGHGLPDGQFFLDWDTACFGQFTSNQLRCLEHLLDDGCCIHPGVLTWAATGGDLDVVRFLHSREVSLWSSACDESAQDKLARDAAREMVLRDYADLLYSNTIAIPEMPEDAEHMREVLHYGWAMGAPLTPVMKEVFEAKRAATRATLLCFHVATGLSQTEGASWEQTAAWAVMGRVPTEIIEKILLDAECEIADTLRRSVQRDRSTKVVQLAGYPSRTAWTRKDGS
jgi:hypothetical protein